MLHRPSTAGRSLAATWIASFALAVGSAAHARAQGPAPAQATPPTIAAGPGLTANQALFAQQRQQRLARAAQQLSALSPAAIQALANSGATRNTFSARQMMTAQRQTAWMVTVSTPVLNMPMLAPGYGGTSHLIRLLVPATGYDEIFSLFVPGSPAGVDRPMLVGFHSFGVSHLDLLFSTDFFFECEQRDWFMVAPFQFSAVGDSQTHYASAQSQLHVELVLDWVTTAYDVDPDRIYGVGFSMGGGAALSYAARHRDDRKPTFAAVVNHTGVVSTRNEYYNVPPPVQQQLQLLFGGPPTSAVAEFNYQRSSVLDIGPAGFVIPNGNHMASNLESVPILTVYGAADPLASLRRQCDLLDGFMGGLPAATHQLVVATVPAPCFQTFAAGHCWDTLDETFACDWLAQHVLRRPTRGSLVADRSGRWDTLDLVQRNTGRFSKLDYLFEPAINRVILFNRDNLQTIRVEPESASLQSSIPLDVATNAVDGMGTVIEIRGVASTPASVLRNGVAAVQSCLPPGLFATWCYDPATDTVRLYEPGAAQAIWRVVP